MGLVFEQEREKMSENFSFQSSTLISSSFFHTDFQYAHSLEFPCSVCDTEQSKYIGEYYEHQQYLKIFSYQNCSFILSKVENILSTEVIFMISMHQHQRWYQLFFFGCILCRAMEYVFVCK